MAPEIHTPRPRRGRIAATTAPVAAALAALADDPPVARMTTPIGRPCTAGLADARIARALATPEGAVVAARAECHADTAPSLAVLGAQGVLPEGAGLDADHPERGDPVRTLRVRLDRAAWEGLR